MPTRTTAGVHLLRTTSVTTTVRLADERYINPLAGPLFELLTLILVLVLAIVHVTGQEPLM